MQYTKEQLEAMEKAAPDMLEALEDLIEQLEFGYPCLKLVGEAIAKAKGEGK